MDIFDTCKVVSELLGQGKESKAREQLIILLDYLAGEKMQYDTLINHLIRETGLYPYMDVETASWDDRFVYEAFRVNIGDDTLPALHREQSALLKKLVSGESLAVSAPTSFGKSFVIDAFIALTQPQNVMILVPTLALTDETRRRIYKKFARTHKIITTSEAELAERNIFIFPPERAINYLDKLVNLDILIVDEFYKASMLFDKERAPALIKAILKIGKISKQRYFLAPNISGLKNNPFTEGMEFFHLDFNTVFLKEFRLYQEIGSDEELKSKKLLEIVNTGLAKTLVYAGTYKNIDKIANIFIGDLKVLNRDLLNGFSDWLGENYDYNWKLTALVQRGVGIHNGQLHRSLSQIQVKLFEEHDGLDNIVSTSSIIEGVNTSAENIVIWSNKSGKVKLNDFSYRNIKGRGGRMFKHFIGKIYILDIPPKEEKTQLVIPFPDEIIGDIDEKKFERELTQDQIARIILHKEEMESIFGQEVFERLQAANLFQSNNADLVKRIALDMKHRPSSWNGLGYLNSNDVQNWDRLLFKIIGLQPAGWDSEHKPLVEFIKALRSNWKLGIPELLRILEPYEIGIEDFFKLERKVTFKLSSLMNDVNVIQRELLGEKATDISKFVNYSAHAWLPQVVFHLEEFGLPRMISKKFQALQIINFYDPALSVHSALESFSQMNLSSVMAEGKFSEFEAYIIEYFLDGIRINS